MAAPQGDGGTSIPPEQLTRVTFWWKNRKTFSDLSHWIKVADKTKVGSDHHKSSIAKQR